MDLSLDFNRNHAIWQRLVNLSLLVYTLLFVSANLAPGKYFDSEIHWLEALAGAVLWVLFLIKFFKTDSSQRKQWLKTNSLVIIFLALGVVNFAYNGFAYSVARTIFIESIYLVIITKYMCDTDYIRNVIFKVFIGVTLVVNLLPYVSNLILYVTNFNQGFVNLLYKVSFIDSKHALSYSFFYSNPNAMGIMTAISMILAVVIFKWNRQNKVKNVLFVIFMVFSCYCLMVSECRSAIVSLVVALLGCLFIKLVGKSHASFITSLALIGVVVVCAGLMIFIGSHAKTGMNNFTKAEVKMTTVSSDRYVIWKGTYLSQKDTSLLLGEGSLKFVEEGRDEYLENNYANFFSYKDEDELTQLENAGQLETGLNFVTAFLKEHNLTGTGSVEKLIKKESEKRYEAEKAKIEEQIANKEHVNRIKNIDTHNGYYSVLFCNGLVGFVIFILIMLQRIMQMKLSGARRWPLPVMFLLFLNVFESAFIADRFFPVVILFMVLSLDDRYGKEGKLHD